MSADARDARRRSVPQDPEKQAEAAVRAAINATTGPKGTSGGEPDRPGGDAREPEGTQRRRAGEAGRDARNTEGPPERGAGASGGGGTSQGAAKADRGG
ncbi:hypothetical protein GRC12_44730, partial [Streptomyces griseorubiginosus]|nr:hypothetical protein [Streptomyces griseorubiginosus]